LQKPSTSTGTRRTSASSTPSIDFYGDKLLSPEKAQRYQITRKDILEILGKTEENIKDGVTIKEVVPFFEKFKLRLKVYDIFTNLVFKYEPPVPNRTNPVMYCAFHEGHIDTLNHDLPALAQKGLEGDQRGGGKGVGGFRLQGEACAGSEASHD
jgi:predicted DNA-binding protein YlxM (UPF0122 family)